MKAFAKTLLALTFALGSSAAYSKQTLVVWEDDNKSVGIENAVRDFNSMYNCEVQVREKSSVEHLNEYKKLKAEGQATPDVFIMISDRVGEALSDNLIAPLSFMGADSGKYAHAAVTPFIVGNQYYASPRSIETLVIYYNRDVMDYPFETFDEYVSFAKQRKQSNAYGLIAKMDNFYFSYGMIGGFGGYVFGINADGSFNAKDVGLNNEGAVRGLNVISDYANSYLPPVLLTDEGWGEIDKLFIEGKAAAVLTGPWSLESYSKAGVNYGLAPLPKLPNGNYMKPFYGVKGYVVSADCSDKALAEKFIAFVNQPKYALERYSKIAELPPVLEVMDNPLIVNDDFANALSQQILHADPMPSIPEMGRVWGAMGDALNAVIKDHADAKESLDRAASAVLGQEASAVEAKTEDTGLSPDDELLLAEEGLLDEPASDSQDGAENSGSENASEVSETSQAADDSEAAQSSDSALAADETMTSENTDDAAGAASAEAVEGSDAQETEESESAQASESGAEDAASQESSSDNAESQTEESTQEAAAE